MPLYEYFCESCGVKTELIEKADAPPSTECPHCKSHAFKRVLSSSFGMHFKGSGFYITDYASKGASHGSQGNDPTKGASCGSSCKCH